MIKWYKRRGGFKPRTPWMYKPTRPISRPAPFTVPINRPGLGQELQPLNKLQRKTGPSASPKTDTQMKRIQRRWVAPKVRIRRGPWGTFPARPQKPRKSSATRIKPMGSGTTFSFYKERSKYRSFRKRVAVLSPRQTHLATVGARMEWTYSNQGRGNYTIASKPAILELCNNIAGYNDSTRFFLKDGSDEFFFSNQSNANAYLKIYHYWVRRDTDSTISALMERGLADIAGGSGTTPTADNYGITPFMAPTIAPFYKFARSYYVELGAGRSHRHVCKYSWNKEWNQEIYAESLGSTVVGTQSKLAGWTRVIFILAHGEPVNDVTDKTKVVPSGGAIDVVRKSQLNYYYGNPTNPLIEFSNALPTTAVTENIMEADTDQASVIERA